MVAADRDKYVEGGAFVASATILISLPSLSSAPGLRRSHSPFRSTNGVPRGFSPAERPLHRSGERSGGHFPVGVASYELMLGGTRRRPLPTPGRSSMSEMFFESLPVTTLTAPSSNDRSRAFPISDISGKRRKSDQFSWSSRHKSNSLASSSSRAPVQAVETSPPGDG